LSTVSSRSSAFSVTRTFELVFVRSAEVTLRLVVVLRFFFSLLTPARPTAAGTGAILEHAALLW